MDVEGWRSFELVEPKYRLPTWLQALWVIVAIPLNVVPFFMDTEAWGSIATAAIIAFILLLTAIIALALFTVGYNKTKTGVWLPGAKKNAPK